MFKSPVSQTCSQHTGNTDATKLTANQKKFISQKTIDRLFPTQTPKQRICIHETTIFKKSVPFYSLASEASVKNDNKRKSEKQFYSRQFNSPGFPGGLSTSSPDASKNRPSLLYFQSNPNPSLPDYLRKFTGNPPSPRLKEGKEEKDNADAAAKRQRKLEWFENKRIKTVEYWNNLPMPPICKQWSKVRKHNAAHARQMCKPRPWQVSQKKVFEAIWNADSLVAQWKKRPVNVKILNRLAQPDRKKSNIPKPSRPEAPFSSNLSSGRRKMTKNSSDIPTLSADNTTTRALTPEEVLPFKSFLVNKFGGPHRYLREDSLVHAWRVMDINNNGELDIREFASALRKINFTKQSGISAREMFKKLDKNKNGFVSLNEIDKTAFALFKEQESEKIKNIEERIQKFNEKMEKFNYYYRKPESRKIENVPQLKEFLSIYFGKDQNFDTRPALVKAWFTHFDGDLDGKLTIHEFTKVMREIANGNFNAIYKELIPGDRDEILTAYDFFEGLDKGSHQMYLAELERRKIREKYIQTNFDKRMKLWEGEHLKNPDFDVPPTIEGMKERFIRKFGDLYGYTDPCMCLAACWRYMDVDHNGWLSLAEFCSTLRNLGFKGNILECFKLLNVSGSGKLKVEEFDKGAAKIVKQWGEGDDQEAYYRSMRRQKRIASKHKKDMAIE